MIWSKGAEIGKRKNNENYTENHIHEVKWKKQVHWIVTSKPQNKREKISEKIIIIVSSIR